MMLLLFREYLTGFSKRKQARKKKAQQEIMEKIKEEKREIRKRVSPS